jgi:hypothetical protein
MKKPGKEMCVFTYKYFGTVYDFVVSYVKRK